MKLVDYGAGNLASVARALDHIGAKYDLVADAASVEGADKIILPGVGAFGRAADTLRKRDLIPSLTAAVGSGTPFLGVCLGLQLLFEGSEESPGSPGLGWVEGQCLRFSDDVRVPHVGWSSTSVATSSPLFHGIEDGAYFYYVHSYYVKPTGEDDVSARADHGGEFCAAVSRGNIHAVQFHPEKSQDAGLAVLENFLSRC